MMAQPKNPAGSGETNGAMRIDPALVRQLAKLLSDNELTEIEVQDGERRIKVAREAAPLIAAAPAVPATAPALTAPPMHAKEDIGGDAAAEEVSGNTVKSPMVG